ncbi:MAG: hypothetical protein COZ76_04380 [Flavobacteriales bacterium CG_4_8_14_3_um_filter_35_10]|nr:MAG: hypothetical protein COZ76_04380 [Flavobacteriales bacterium CG_4_8_14_3_um_filter_35_10]PJA05242.1 MAG: hypothetical protein COX71_07765 [Flavobacteriales bacterium CG_4_10_14_0_2_um_filter_35_18]
MEVEQIIFFNFLVIFLVFIGCIYFLLVFNSCFSLTKDWKINIVNVKRFNQNLIYLTVFLFG